VVWWGTGTECISAIAREERIGLLADEAIDRLDVLSEAWLEVAASIAVRRTAARLLRVHSLRAADSLQLAAAIVASEGDPRTLPFVTLDTRLAEAASREGFPMIIPGR
jgi:predicted nucleic acid-binding protein